MGKLSAVLRSWENRFGARVLALGFADLWLSVAAPPATTEEARRVASEHLAFCPDNILGCVGDLPAYAERLTGNPIWSFWWD